MLLRPAKTRIISSRVGECFNKHYPYICSSLTAFASSMGSGAISTSQVVSAAKDAWTIGQDGYGVYKAGKDAWKQLRPQSR